LRQCERNEQEQADRFHRTSVSPRVCFLIPGFMLQFESPVIGRFCR
jgi:hypothetical protein